MINIKIDDKEIRIPEGTPVILAARKHGIEVPSMCYLENQEHITSCMICMVKDRKTDKLFPSCSVQAVDGMDLITMDDEIRESRKIALELLLSEHTGDCEAPCQITCPAHMDIPLMNRLLAAGKFDEALRVVKKDIALPAVFGRICPAPCEGACRRKSVDEAVSICLLKRSAGDHDLHTGTHIPDIAEEKPQSIAILGAGPAGLAAAYYLRLRGYRTALMDRNSEAGGSLHREVKEGVLPPEILGGEIDVLKKMGVQFKMNYSIDTENFESLKKEYDAVLIATGSGSSGAENWGLERGERGIKADKNSYQTANASVFVAGSALRPAKMAIRTLGQGKEVAYSIDQYLKGKKVEGEKFLFNSRFGKLKELEISEYLKESVEGNRIEPKDLKSGLTVEEVINEASRCMRCDCRDLENCKLRIYSDVYEAKQRRYSSEERSLVRKDFQHEILIYEPSKCIRCGVCVKICRDNGEEFGLTFIGRGFDIQIGIPFNESMKKGIYTLAKETAQACPTGALACK
jgi:NADPH-dependent glutamate synthase beta subunit-like oxidoreductase/ferredoxin